MELIRKILLVILALVLVTVMILTWGSVGSAVMGLCLIMLVSALMGREEALAAYREAVEKEYRFFSFGDCMLIL